MARSSSHPKTSGRCNNRRRISKASSTFGEVSPLFVISASLLLLTLTPIATKAQINGPLATSLCDELIRPLNYTCDEYQVVTGDGFILGIQNVPFGHGKTSSMPPHQAVILQHGLVAGGENWVLNQPSEGLAFILADAGFDVWIANNRNVQWSHGNINFNDTLDPRYWNWTYDELASFDLEASTKFVYNHTGKNKIFYVGHSQGTSMLLAGLTGGQFKKEVLGYLKGAVLLAPIASIAHTTNPILQLALTIYADLLLGDGEFNPNPLVYTPCHIGLTQPSPACLLAFQVPGGTNNYVNQSRLQFYTNYFPQPSSALNIQHYGQSFRTDTFQFYDRGAIGNQIAYGQPTPPTYNLTTFPASLPLQIWTGSVDQLADPVDVANLLSQLPSVNRTVINLLDYGHEDFILGYRANVDIYPRIIRFFQSL